MARLCVLSSPMDPDLLFSSMRVSDRLSRMYEIDIEAVSSRDDLLPKDILGRWVSVAIDHGDGVKRDFSGYVTQFTNGGSLGRRFVYRLQVRPGIFGLTRTADSKIFQNLNIVDIADKIIFGRKRSSSLAWEQRLLDRSVYKPWEYCVQYRESDYAFVTRLLEQEGIYWYFEQKATQGLMVLIDDKTKHKPISGQSSISYVPASQEQVHRNDVITEWRQIQEIQPNKFTLKDYDFVKPKSEQMVTRKPQNPHEHAESGADFEIYDYPGDFDPVDGQALAQGDPYVAARAEELATNSIVFRGEGLLRQFHVGQRFKLIDHPRNDQNGEYLIVGTEYVYEDIHHESGQKSGSKFKCSFTAIPYAQQFRPPRVTRRPLIHGVQTAKVTGPANEEIHTDKYGRIKVHFHWDRFGPTDDTSSCYLRVSTLAAGNNWGFISIPRIGQEVIVSFLEGDPDRPIVTGMVYNGEHMPPWKLPDNKTQWGMLSRSSLKGTDQNANALRFEDLKGQEEVWLHAEKNQKIEVENDETHWVGHDRAKTVDNDENVHIKHDRTEVVDRNETITVKGDRVEKVEKNEKIDITGNRTETVKGNEKVDVTGNRSLTVGKDEKGDTKGSTGMKVGKSYKLEAGTEIVLKTGAASLTMKMDGTIELKGVNVTVNGAKIEIAGMGLVDIKAPMVKINS
ncbi:MAG: type VI secretion system tip protein VgrG [Burkholderiaceae bacterium]|nr:type VI secretion system tip protein VgrG [Burkholderiaceae bacterium]